MIYNYLGLGIGAISLLVGYLVQAAVGHPVGANSLAVMAACGTAMVIDLTYRWCNNRLEGLSRFVDLSAGGMLSLLPLWLFAIAVFVYESTQIMLPS